MHLLQFFSCFYFRCSSISLVGIVDAFRSSSYFWIITPCTLKVQIFSFSLPYILWSFLQLNSTNFKSHKFSLDQTLVINRNTKSRKLSGEKKQIKKVLWIWICPKNKEYHSQIISVLQLPCANYSPSILIQKIRALQIREKNYSPLNL